MRVLVGHTLIRASAIAVLVVIVLIVVAVLKWRSLQPDSPVPPTYFVQGDSPIDSIEYSADGKYLMTGGSGTVSFRDGQTGRLVRQWPGGGDRRWFSTDGSLMLEDHYTRAGSFAYCVLRETMQGKALRQWPGVAKCIALDFSYMVLVPNKSAKYRNAHVALIIAVKSGRNVGRVGLPPKTPSMHISDHGKWLALQSWEAPARLLHLPDLQSRVHLPQLNSLTVTEDEKRAIGIGPDGALDRWQLPSGAHSAISTGLSMADCNDVIGRSLFVHGQAKGQQSSGDVLQIRSSDGFRLIKTVQGCVETYSADGSYLAFASSDDSGAGRCYVLNAVDGSTLAKLDSVVDSLGQIETGAEANCVQYAISPDGNRIACATQSGLIRLYDLRKQAPEPQGEVSADPGRRVLSAAPNDQGVIADVTVLPDGGVAAVGGDGSYRDKMHVMQWKSGHVTSNVEVGREIGFVERLGISPDGTLIAAASHMGLWTHNVQTGQEAMTAMPPGVYTASQAIGRPVWLDGPDQPISTMAENQGTVVRWDSDTATPRVTIPYSESVGGIAYAVKQTQASSDGKLTIVCLWTADSSNGNRHVAAEPVSGILEARDTKTGRLIRRLDSSAADWHSWANPNETYRFAISPDKSTVAASTSNGLILLWSIRTGHRIGMMTCSRCGASKLASRYPRSALLAFSPDSRILAAARYDGSIYLYSMHTHLPVAQIGQTVPLNDFYARPLTWLGYDAKGGYVYGTALYDPHVLAWKVPDLPRRSRHPSRNGKGIALRRFDRFTTHLTRQAQ